MFKLKIVQCYYTNFILQNILYYWIFNGCSISLHIANYVLCMRHMQLQKLEIESQIAPNNFEGLIFISERKFPIMQTDFYSAGSMDHTGDESTKVARRLTQQITDGLAEHQRVGSDVFGAVYQV